MSVFKNSNGVWGFKVRVNGKQVKRESKEWKKKDAEKAERELLNNYVEVKEKITLYEVHKRMLEELSVKEKSKDYYERSMKRMGNIVNIPINKITPYDIKKWQSEFSKKYTGQTVKTSQSYIKRLFKYAYDNNLISDIKIANFTTIKPQRKEKITQNQFYTLEEFNKLYEVLDNDRDRLVYRMLMFTGMRIGELLALQVKHVKDDRIIIEQTQGINREISTPKTLNSYRVVILDDTTKTLLNDYIKGVDSECYVVTKNYYMYLYATLCQRHLAREKKYNLKHIKLHGFRHSHVSMLINKGFSAHDIADRIGDTVTMVNEVYGHLYEDNQAKIAEALKNL